MKITVNKWDIHLGKRRDASYCPVARAVARAFGVHHQSVRVATRIVVAKNGQSLYWKVKRKLAKWIDRSDGGFRLTPITFSIGKPDAVDRGFMFSQMLERIYDR